MQRVSDRLPVGKTRIFIIAGELSGDDLGARLIKALRAHYGNTVMFRGIGGPAMAAQGLDSLFPMDELSVMGFSAVLARLPRLLARIDETTQAAIAFRPDALVIIDSPDFTHRVARQLRKRARHIPVINYVPPSVWAWRPGRAPKMRAYVDRALALLPFEPAAFARLQGPLTHFVGHPLTDEINLVRPRPGERRALPPGGETGHIANLLLLPGSRRSEIDKLLATAGATIDELGRILPQLQVRILAVDHLAKLIAARTRHWSPMPDIVLPHQKSKALRTAHAALAASGTATLELALAGVPTIVMYRLDFFMKILRWLDRWFNIFTVSSIALPNLVLDARAMPEYIDRDVTPDRLATALLPLLADTPVRRTQLEAFSRLEAMLATPARGPAAPRGARDDESPATASSMAAQIIADVIATHDLQNTTGGSRE